MKQQTNTSVTTSLIVHDAANIFPLMADEDFKKLREDIRMNGQQMPILIQNGKLLDGRHRYRACLELGIPPKFEELPISDEPAQQLILSLNLHRRHLSESQRAMVAARLSNLGVGSNQHTAQAVTQSQAASDMKVSVDSLQRAKSVINLGTKELVQAVVAGHLNVSNAATIATLPGVDQKRALLSSDKEVLALAKAIRREKTAERRTQVLADIEAKRANNVPLDPNMGPYSVILADPPWDYLAEANIGYPTMPLADIYAMPVNQLAAEDAVLFLWCSASLMREALAVIDAWGFTYKTQAIWDKKSPGQGVYFRGQHEVLMLATRGKVPEVPPPARPSSMMSLPRREHSRKPDEVYDLIESMYPELNKIELFCRGPAHSGTTQWAGWGNECVPAAPKVVQTAELSVFGINEVQSAANGPRMNIRKKKVGSVEKQAA